MTAMYSFISVSRYRRCVSAQGYRSRSGVREQFYFDCSLVIVICCPVRVMINIWWYITIRLSLLMSLLMFLLQSVGTIVGSRVDFCGGGRGRVRTEWGAPELRLPTGSFQNNGQLLSLSLSLSLPLSLSLSLSLTLVFHLTFSETSGALCCSEVLPFLR